MKQDGEDLKNATSSTQVDKFEEKEKNIPEQKEFFDIIADFFKLMTKGIIVFAFWKLPCKIIKWLKDLDVIAILKFLFRMWRAIFWISIWILAVFAAWILLAWDKFVKFWTFVGQEICKYFKLILKYITEDIFKFLLEYGPEIWFGIAIAGSIYGLLYLTLKRRAKKKNEPFSGVFAFFKRKKAKEKEEKNIPQGNNEDTSSNKPIS